MTKDEAINEIGMAISIIKQDGKDWLDERDIPILEMAIESLKQNQWIPCSERLPEVGEDVLISYDGNTYEAHLRESKEYFLTHKTKALVAEWEVDAWMPLPEPWKGEQNERT